MKHLLSVIAMALVMVGSTAMARDGDGRRSEPGRSYRSDSHGHRGDRHFDRKWQYDDRKFRADRKFDEHRSHERRFYDRSFDRRSTDRRFYKDRVFYHSFRRGDRLPSVFLGTRFVINDFGSHRLYRPPRGYRWVRVERDAFLVGVATGVILTVVTDRFF